jgi:FAD/FMN-containing dehydrogenase
MAFSRHPHRKARAAANAAALRAVGLTSADADGFLGELVYPSNPSYELDRQVDNRAFQGFPALIAYCEAESDVAWCLQRAQARGWSAVCRSGGHSTAGFSTLDGGLVIDTSRLNWALLPPFLPPPDPFPFCVGPGTSFAKFNGYLSPYGLHVPGGGCGDVCVAGYMQGGGYGFTSRQFGMNSDNVLAFDMMLANGQVVSADRSTNGDLFWAVRGGTGNNFGVLTAVAYELQYMPSVWGVWLQWPLASAAQALLEMQTNFMLSGAPDNFGYMTIITPQNGTSVLMMRAMFNGSEADLDALIQPLLAIPGAGPPPDFPLKKSGTYDAMNDALLSKPFDIPQLGAYAQWGEDKLAGYITAPLQLSDWQAIVDYYDSAPLPGRTVVLEPYGGAINRVPVGDSAFIHRNASMDFFVDIFWDITTQGEIEAKKWLHGFEALMQSYFDGRVYQNYPRRSLVNFQEAYWAGAYRTLVLVKNKYDPNNFFNFPQSIGLSADGYPLPRIPTAADPFLDRPITYSRGRPAGR